MSDLASFQKRVLYICTQMKLNNFVKKFNFYFNYAYHSRRVYLLQFSCNKRLWNMQSWILQRRSQKTPSHINWSVLTNQNQNWRRKRKVGIWHVWCCSEKITEEKATCVYFLKNAQHVNCNKTGVINDPLGLPTVAANSDFRLISKVLGRQKDVRTYNQCENSDLNRPWLWSVSWINWSTRPTYSHGL